MLLLFNDNVPPPAPLLERWFTDDFRLRPAGQQLSGNAPAPYLRIAREGTNNTELNTVVEAAFPHPVARTQAGGLYAVDEWFIPRAMRPVADALVRVGFRNPYSYSGGNTQPGPSSPGYDSDPTLILRYQDADNWVFVHPQNYTKRFMVYEVAGGALAGQHDLGDISHPLDGWMSTAAWRRTLFHTPDPLLWDVQIKGRNLTGAIRNRLTGTALFSFAVTLTRTSRGVVGFGTRRHFSGLAAWEYIAVDAIKTGGWDTRSRRLRNLMRGLEDGGERIRR